MQRFRKGRIWYNLEILRSVCPSRILMYKFQSALILVEQCNNTSLQSVRSGMIESRSSQYQILSWNNHDQMRKPTFIHIQET